MKKSTLKKLIYQVTLIIIAFSFAMIIITSFSYSLEAIQRQESAQKLAQNEIARAAKEVDIQLKRLSDVGKKLAEKLTSGEIKNEQLVNQLINTMKENPDFFGIGVAYLPYAYNPAQRLYAPYYAKIDGTLQLIQVESLYDYTQIPSSEYDWFNTALTKKVVWPEPFFGQAANTMLASFHLVFYEQDPKTKEKIAKGVIYCDYSLDNVKSIIKSLNLGKTGYAYLISQKGNYLSHPIEKFVHERVNIFEEAKKIKNEEMRIFAEKATRGERGAVYNNSLTTGRVSWVLYEPISATKGSLVAVFFEEEFLGNTRSLYRKKIRISIAVMIFLLFSVILGLRADRGGFKNLCLVAASTAILLFGEIGFIWYLVLNEYPYNHSQHSAIFEKTQLTNFLSTVNSKKKYHNQTPFYIPTGVFIQSMQFITGNNLMITGYIWQKYDQKIPSYISRNFTFPDSIAAKITESYHHQEGDIELIGWYFEATFRENFDYAKYPFDDKEVLIRFWPKNFTDNVLLIPDLDGYQLINQNSLPGIEENLVLPGWNLSKSFFLYQTNEYNSNFGFSTNLPTIQEFPDLYFTVILQRDIISSLLNMIRIAVVSFLLFALQLLMRKKEDLKYLGFSASSIVSSGGGFILFVLAADQLNFRSNIAVVGIAYIEYLYFVLYVIIVLIAIDALLFASGANITIIEYRDNLIPKLLYWPILLKLFLIITLVIFY